MIKAKSIRNESTGRVFLRRLSLYFKDGSTLKFHWITDDDNDEHHDHPWDFTSLILFGGYNETTEPLPFITKVQRYGWLSRNKKLHNIKHNIRLFRLFGFKVPTLTVGFYSKKLQLCSLCKSLGYCKQSVQK